jgi:hypothetical protein
MRRIAFNVTLIISLTMLALCLLGFGGTIGVLIRRPSPTVASPYSERTIVLDRGRFTIWTETWPAPPSPPPGAQIPTRLSIEPVARFPLRFPKINGHALGGFDAHWLDAPGRGGGALYLIACPIWALALPSLLAPTIWFRRRHAERRRKRQQHGFPITSIDTKPQP